MEEVRYMISDAANLLHVESHVLRYWEEELELEVPRNEMGHRYYTEENIRQFEQIRKLKEEGYQLKAIKMLVHNKNAEIPADKAEVVPKKPKAVQTHGPVASQTGMSKLEQFQILMTRIVKEAIAENNRDLGKEISAQVGEKVIKEMNYLIREQEEQQEERYRKLDEAIRSRQRRNRRQKKERRSRMKKEDKSKAVLLETKESTAG